MKDQIYKPQHYQGKGVECIDAIKSALKSTPHGFESYCRGNVMKYIFRYREKGGEQDLLKARVYLDWLIIEVSEQNEE